jgi:putative sigma-54 modulation protein
MQVNVSGHHIEVTEFLKSHVETKLEKLKRHFDQIAHIDVILKVEKQRQMSEATIKISGKEIFAEAESDDLYTAIDLMTEKLDRQLIKQKEKVSDRKHRPAVRQ